MTEGLATKAQSGPQGNVTDEEFVGLPFQPFDKSQFLHKYCDFSSNTDRPEDADEFQLIDSKLKSKLRAKSNLLNMQKKPVTTNQPTPRQQFQYQSQWYQNQYVQQRQRVYREASVVIKGDWEVLAELTKLHFDKKQAIPGEAEDLLVTGNVYNFNAKYRELTAKQQMPLKGNADAFNITSSYLPDGRSFSSTSQDPVMENFINAKEADVFITDSILSTIMTQTRSIYPWDIIIKKTENGIVFDKRNNSTLEMFSLNENADVYEEDEQTKEIIKETSAQTALVNKLFQQKVLTGNPTSYEVHPVAAILEESKTTQTSTGIAYRRWKINDRVRVIVRTEFEALRTAGSEPGRTKLKALYEYNTKLTGDYRRKLDTTRGQIFSTECKNNLCKLSRWAVESQLVGADTINLGFASRKDNRSKDEYDLLGVHAIMTRELNTNLTLNYNICWGTFMEILKIIQEQQNGTFLLVRDPNRAVTRLFSVPNPDDVEDETPFL